MSQTFFKRMILGSAMAACIVAGTLWGQTATPPATTGPATTTTAPMDEVIAVINGVPISSRFFYDRLMEIAGARVFPQVLDLTLVEQACANVRISMQDDKFKALVKAEIKRALDSMENIPEDKREAMLGQLLARQGVTQAEFLIRMNINAGLRRLAEINPPPPPTPEELKQGYQAMFGPKVKIELMTFGDMKEAAAAKDDISKGENVAVATQKHGGQVQELTISENADQQSLKTIKDTAFGMEPKQMSPIIPQNLPQGSYQQVIYLVEKVPADKTAKESDPAIQEKVKKALDSIKIQNAMNEIMNSLRKNVRVEFRDARLAAIYQSLLAPTTQSTTATAPAPATVPAPGGAAPKPK